MGAGLAALAGALIASPFNVYPAVGFSLTIKALAITILGGLGTAWGAALLFLMSEGLRLVGVVYNLIAVGLVIMIFVPRDLAGIAIGSRRRVVRGDAVRPGRAAGDSIGSGR